MYKNGERVMAWIAKIDEIKSIPDADSISAYRVGGWWVVDKKSAHFVGDFVVYVSIDSWVPHELAPFLSKGQEPREYMGIKGERLRTVRLRGTTSQGLLLKIEDIFDLVEKDGKKYINICDSKQLAQGDINADLSNTKQSD